VGIDVLDTGFELLRNNDMTPRLPPSANVEVAKAIILKNNLGGVFHNEFFWLQVGDIPFNLRLLPIYKQFCRERIDSPNFLRDVFETNFARVKSDLASTAYLLKNEFQTIGDDGN
jgi:hypothetical protein